MPAGAAALVVDDTLAGAARGSVQAGRDRFEGRVVAVTGSVGQDDDEGDAADGALAPFGSGSCG